VGYAAGSQISAIQRGLSWCWNAVEFPESMGYNYTQERDWRVNDGKMERHYDFWILGDAGYRNLRFPFC
jgi:hypothetical protein